MYLSMLGAANTTQIIPSKPPGYSRHNRKLGGDGGYFGLLPCGFSIGRSPSRTVGVRLLFAIAEKFTTLRSLRFPR